MNLSKLQSRQLILLFFAVWTLDLVINVINANRPAWIPILVLDRYIPFIPSFIYFYSLYFPLVIVPLFVFARDKIHLENYVRASLYVMFVSYAIFLLVPTQLKRVVVDGQTAAGDLTLLYHKLVAPVNLLPSMHASMLIVSLLAFWRYERRLGIFVSAPIVLSIVSVVFTKQHYVLDLIAAVPLGTVAFAVAIRRQRRVSI